LDGKRGAGFPENKPQKTRIDGRGHEAVFRSREHAGRNSREMGVTVKNRKSKKICDVVG
jgi:hypothetical protein